MAINKVTKVHIIKEESGDTLEVMYNPPELSSSKSANYSEIEIPGLSLPLYQFVSGGAKTFDFTLEFNQLADRNRDLKEDIEWLEELQEPVPGDTPIEKAPPIVILNWGKLFNTPPRGIITKVNTNYVSMFPDLSPKEVTIDMTLKRILE